MNKALLLTCAFLASIAGCKSTQAEQPQDATLVRVNPGVITELQQAIQSAKGGALVTLADDVFTKSAELLIDHGTNKGPDGLPIMGAHSIPSEKFVLQKAGEQCLLYYPKKELRIPLPNVECEVN
ncbi:hypothetical protein [Pseudoalteromonas gelatinilytica]|uniref:Lipoprotein n=1 Tax=Pseudoalteromonas gelatinilytica TaxID=1703256 RepID=A0A3A3EPS2_9GAMM|nr:hypothetical protein [Pseudoalteromonas profundi]RJF38165.1 hypothetical protein D4741_08900 [Pseudoalteromonas profundi]